MSYTVTRAFSAPAEVVYGTATDPDRWARWLPQGMAIEHAGQDELHVQWSGRTHKIRWDTAPERMQATARPLALPWRAAMRVREGSGGASEVELEIDGDNGSLRRAAEQALKYLDAEVSDNFNAG